MQILVGFRFGFDPVNITGVIDQMISARSTTGLLQDRGPRACPDEPGILIRAVFE